MRPAFATAWEIAREYPVKTVAFLASAVILVLMVVNPFNPAPTGASTTVTTVHHSMCSQATGECYDPAGDYQPPSYDDGRTP